MAVYWVNTYNNQLGPWKCRLWPMRQLIKTTTYFLCVKVDTFLFLTFYWGKRVGLPMSYHQHCISYTITTSVYPPPPFATVVKHSPFMAFFQKKVKLLVGLLLSVWHIVFPTKAKKKAIKIKPFCGCVRISNRSTKKIDPQTDWFPTVRVLCKDHPKTCILEVILISYENHQNTIYHHFCRVVFSTLL